jgi:hypothetical protein
VILTCSADSKSQQAKSYFSINTTAPNERPYSHPLQEEMSLTLKQMLEPGKATVIQETMNYLSPHDLDQLREAASISTEFSENLNPVYLPTPKQVCSNAPGLPQIPSLQGIEHGAFSTNPFNLAKAGPRQLCFQLHLDTTYNNELLTPCQGNRLGLDSGKLHGNNLLVCKPCNEENAVDFPLARYCKGPFVIAKLCAPCSHDFNTTHPESRLECTCQESASPEKLHLCYDCRAEWIQRYFQYVVREAQAHLVPLAGNSSYPLLGVVHRFRVFHFETGTNCLGCRIAYEAVEQTYPVITNYPGEGGNYGLAGLHICLRCKRRVTKTEERRVLMVQQEYRETRATREERWREERAARIS